MKQCRWLLTLLVLITAASTFAQDVARGQRWEKPFTTNTQFNWTTSKLCVQFTSPSAQVYTGLGYWDSRATTDTFKVRAAFNETGAWSWLLTNDTGCVSTSNITSAISGSFNVTADTTGLPLFANGPVRTNGHYLIYSGNSAPFHWIGDTAWAGPHLAPIATWQTYTTDRKNKAFSVIQVAAPIALGALTHVDNGAPPFYDPAGGGACNTGPLPRAVCLPNAAFWTAWDAHISDINAKGMLASVIGLYKRTDESNNWPTLSDSDGYARFIASRLAGNYTTLAPGFDEVPNVGVGDFTTGCSNVVPGTENQACRAREIGTAIKQAILMKTSINAPRTAPPLSALVTHHIGGGCPSGGDGSTCVVDQWLSTFHAETWLDFDLVQSGQGLNCHPTIGQQEDCIAIRSSLRMLRLYNLATAKPVINGEPIYDNNGVKSCGVPNSRYDEIHGRQTAFNTLLSDGGAGFTYGIGGTWDWGGFSSCRTVAQSLAAPSSTQIGKLKTAFSTLPWQRLVPDCQVWGTACTDIKNNEQTGATQHLKRMYASDSSGLFAVAFLPIGVTDSSLKLNLDNLPGFSAAAPWKSVWYNPRASCTCNATAVFVSGTTWSFNRPNSTVDWGLILRNTNSIPTLGVAACAPVDCP
jgi:hypothetical protein